MCLWCGEEKDSLTRRVCVCVVLLWISHSVGGEEQRKEIRNKRRWGTEEGSDLRIFPFPHTISHPRALGKPIMSAPTHQPLQRPTQCPLFYLASRGEVGERIIPCSAFQASTEHGWEKE